MTSRVGLGDHEEATEQAAGRPKRIRPAGTKRYAGQVESALLSSDELSSGQGLRTTGSLF
jgi:hypothetical protein